MSDRVGLRDSGFIGIKVALAIIAEELNLCGVLIATRFRHLSNLRQLGPFKHLADRTGTATSGIFVFVGGIDIAKSYGAFGNCINFCDDVINTGPVAVHMNNITYLESVRFTHGDHHIFGVRRPGERNGWAITRCQIDVSAVI